jgi:hypothetical protein
MCPVAAKRRVLFGLWCSIIIAAACGSRRVRTDLPREERGVAVLTAIVLEFKEALRERRFDDATDLLEELEEGVADADGITRSHPDFDDVARAATKARPALQRMVRKDAVEKLVAELQTEVAAAERLNTEVESAGPSSARLARLRDTAATIETLLAEGDELGDEHTWADLRPGFAKKLGRCRRHLAEYGWVLRLTEELEPRLSAALAAEAVANDREAPAAERLQAGREAMAAFRDCVALSARYRAQPGYSDTVKIRTELGEVSIDEAGLTCEFRRVAIESRLAILEWGGTVEGIVGRVRDVMQRMRATATADAEIAVTGEAIEVLAHCAYALRRAAEAQGFDASARFDTPFGQLNALRLAEACAQERDQLGAKNPTMQWRAGLEHLRQLAAEARAGAEAAKRARDLGAKVTHLSAALSGYEECVEQARFLGQRGSIQGAQPHARERAAVRKLGQSCKKQRTRVGKLLAKAKRANRDR